MIDGVRLKICGLRRAADARLAAELGADFLGFILYQKSPRFIGFEEWARLSAELPAGPKRVAVMVEPDAEELARARAAGFERFQIHARHDLPLERVRAWSESVGAERLWLEPKRAPGVAFPAAWIEWADTFLVDTYHADGFGGSGRTGDWAGFAELARLHPAKTWILAGGLSPENIAEARRRGGAVFFDANSGVEDAPGEKSADKLRALAAALRGAGACAGDGAVQ